MKLGDRAWYTSTQLAERWGVTGELIEHYVEIGILSIAACLPQTDYDFPAYVYPTNEQYIFLMKEVERFEQKQELQVSSFEAPSYLDPSHGYYSEELATAVNVWLDLFENKKIRIDRAIKPQISAALSGKGLSQAAIDRISTLINPKKGGGPPPTGY